ncbi:MAG: biotin--[acetyl-CoA-carboxylase] ligase [Parafannyhessea sp.]|uniref:biotin--[acetyl-CoA-carboxylase] ligase n=1 Tax=Parafannyhessea sp. TaxID=2847324 RepID=UPI003EFFC6E8
MAGATDMPGAGDPRDTRGTSGARTDLPAVEVLDSCESTNDEARDRALAGAPHGAAVAAHRQTLGRGRRGHVWVSPPGGLYLSIVLRPDVPARGDAGEKDGPLADDRGLGLLRALPVASGLGALDACRALGATAPHLKWPNDLVICNSVDRVRKLGGILVELSASSAGGFAVCGIGVNLTRPRGNGIRPAAVRDGMVGAFEPAYLGECLDGGALPDYDAVATAFRDAIVSRVDAWAAGLAARPGNGPLAPILADYQASLYNLGHRVRAVATDGSLAGEGTFLSVDAWGHAVLGLADGTTLAVDCERTSLRDAWASAR